MRDVPRNLEPYFIGLLRRGGRWNDIQGSEGTGILERHLAYIRAQVQAGRYVLAGPITGSGPYVGLLIIRAGTAEEALTLAANDPGVQEDRLAVEIHPALLPSLSAVQVRYS
jgi:uncharacterized protein YciI